MTTLPTLEQLASLAAGIPHVATAAAKVQLALDIWKEAQRALDHQNRIAEQSANSRNKNETMTEGMNLRDGMKLDEFLREVFPNSKHGDRARWHREYLRDHLTHFHPDMTAAQIEKRIPEIIARDKAEGMPFAKMSAIQLLKWRVQSSANQRQERAAKGANAKKSKNNALPHPDASKNATSKTKKAASKTKRATSKKSKAAS